MKILNLIILLVLLVPKIQAFEEGEGNVDIEIELLSSIPGRDLQWDWWQARTAFVPSSKDGKGAKSKWVTTMSETCLLYTSPSPRDISGSRMPSSA